MTLAHRRPWPVAVPGPVPARTCPDCGARMTFAGTADDRPLFVTWPGQLCAWQRLRYRCGDCGTRHTILVAAGDPPA